MSVLTDLTSRNTATASRATNSRTAQADRPAAKAWLNVGYMADDKFINLPLGLAIDTMEKIEVRTQNEEFAQLQHARNELLMALQEEADKLEPGEEKEVNLIVKIRHVNNQLTVDKDSNPLSMKAAGFSLVK